MDQTSVKEEPVRILGIEATERRRAPRRLVQSTLFPQRSGDSGDSKEEGDDGDDDYFCCSQGKKMRKRKGQGTPKNSGSKKVAKEKSHSSSTPKKNASRNGSLEASLKETEDASPLPNLRWEAKLRAEENSRMFVGKQIHPFFSSWKAGRRSPEVVGGNDRLLSEKNVIIRPIHVFEKSQDDCAPIDWSNWTFYDETPRTSGSVGTNIVKMPEKEVNSSEYCTLLAPYDTSAYLRKEWSHYVTQLSKPLSASHAITFVQDKGLQIAEESGMNIARDEVASLSYCLFEETCFKDSDQSTNCLWTDKYHPKRAVEVCGNTESVKLLSEWLQFWREKNLYGVKDFAGSQKSMLASHSSCGNDSDSDCTEEGGFKNVLLVSGPAGSGKSAAIRACAKEQGFVILESNSSEVRNGASIKQKFGEALESHCLTRSLENVMDPLNGENIKTMECLSSNGAGEAYGNEEFEVMPVSDEENESQGDHANLKPLILFEDVDISFPEDRGFVSAVQQISEKAKGPVVMTSSSRSHGLPDNLDRLELCFVTPSTADLLGHLSSVCRAEKLHVEPALLEQLIKFCQGDIRKTILQMQFWFQSESFTIARSGPSVLETLPFDLEAGHWFLPKIIPWSLPSQLSQLVEDEVAKSLSFETLTEVLVEEVDDEEMFKRLVINEETDDMQAKKEAMLRMNFSADDFNEFQDLNDLDYDSLMLSGIQHYPSRSTRKRQCAVVSSDSEDEILHDRCISEVAKSDDDNLVKDSIRCISQFWDTSPCEDMGDDGVLPFKARSPGDSCYDSDTADMSCLKNKCSSIDVSCVPESSFVPETQVDDGLELSQSTVSCGNFPGVVEVSISEPAYGSEYSLLKCQRVLEEALDAGAEISHEIDAGSSLEDSASLNYQVADECSRIDFVRVPRPRKNRKPDPLNWAVQEAWKRLRQMDLKCHVLEEPKDNCRILELLHRTGNVIAESDLLFSRHKKLEALELWDDSSEKLDLFGLSDEILQIASTMVLQGFCSYTRDVAAIGHVLGSHSSEAQNLRRYTLASSGTDILLEGFEGPSNDLGSGKYLELENGKNYESSKSKRMPRLMSIIKPLVPPRSYLAVHGFAFHEYAACLGLISRSDNSHVSASRPKRRRSQGPQHYLRTGSMMLSPDEIAALSQSSTYTVTPS